MLAGEAMPVADEIATAPGDLPMPEVAARFAARRHQFRHDNTIVPSAPRPGEAVEIEATSGAEMPLDGATLFYTTDGSDPTSTGHGVSMEAANVEWDPSAGYRTSWRGWVPGLPAGTVVRYRIRGRRRGLEAGDSESDVWAHDGQGFWFRFPGEAGITTFAYRVEDPGPPMPAWIEDAAIYHIFLDRFHPGTPDGRWPEGATGPRDRRGGNLRGVRAALPYLADLGVTCLWLSPVHPAETYHRYDGIDYFEVDSDLGTVAELRELVAACHERGIRLLLDYVPSHCSWRHPAFELARLDREAPTASWFTFNAWPDDYRSFLQVSRHLPSFDTQDPGARQYLVDAAVFWLREIGVDGFRLDHAIQPSFDFWVAFRVAMENARPDVFLAGEVTDTPDCIRRYRGRLHGVLDFPLTRALRSTFGAGMWSVATLESFLTAYELYMRDGPGRVSFLDNHDMDRFLWVAGNDIQRLKLAALCQFTLPVPPVVYYGTEVGMTQEVGSREAGFGGDAHARGTMPWDPRAWNSELHAYYRSLIRLRRERPELRRGTRETVHLDAAAGTLGYRLTDGSGGGGTSVVLFNTGNEERDLPLPAGAWRTALGTRDGCVLEGGHARLPGWSGMLLHG